MITFLVNITLYHYLLKTYLRLWLLAKKRFTQNERYNQTCINFVFYMAHMNVCMRVCVYVCVEVRVWP